MIPFEANFTHLNEDVWGSSHHQTNQDKCFDQFGHKNHQIWSIGAGITAIFHFQTTGNIFAQGFSKFFAIFTLIVNARTLLVIMVCIYTCESMILVTKIIKIGWLGQKSWPFFISRLLEKYLPRVFNTFCHLHPYRQCQKTSGHHGMHLHMRKHDFSHKNHQNWSIGWEIMANF